MVEPRTDGRSPYLSTAEAAALLGMTSNGIRASIAAGRLPAKKVGPKSWRIARSTVEALLPAPAPTLPEPTPFERVLELLPHITDAEQRRQLALRALQGAA